MRVLSSRLALTLPMLVACGSHAIDLDHSTLTPSADPTSIGTVRELVTQISVDEERLYWFGSRDQLIIPGLLHSCAKSDCLGSLLTYNDYDSSVTASPIFGVQHGEIFWLRSNGQDRSDLVASNVLDPSMTRVVLPRTQGVVMMAFDAQNAYVTGGITLSSVPLDGTEQVTDLDPFTRVVTMKVLGDYLYGLVSVDEVHGALQRVRTDGTGRIETLTEGFELRVNGGWPFNLRGLAFDTQYVYWTVNVDSGSILRCPLAGCSATPEVIAAPIRAPSALLVDSGKLYFEHETDAFKYALSSCVVGHCDQTTTIVAQLETSSVLAVDDQYLYTATAGRSLDSDPSTHQLASVAQIRRLPK